MSDKALSDDELATIRENFEFADADGNGTIDFKEFQKLLRVLSPDVGTQQAAEGFSMIDKKSDGYIDYEEFLEWWKTVWWEF